MSIDKTYAVFGLGKYGVAVAKELVANGADVIAVDTKETIVNDLASEIPICKCADVTDPEVIKQLGIANVDVVIIAMATHLESSVMAIMHCKEIGVPNIIAKCGNETHRKIMKKVGATQVVLPESDSGIRLAKNLLSSGFIDVIELAKNVSMLELPVKPEWDGKSIIDLNLRKKFSVNIIAVCDGESVSINIDPKMTLKTSMRLIVIANPDKLEKLR